MPYSIKTDLIKLLPEDVIIQLTDDEGLGAVNDARVTEAIAQADAEIDSYCGVKYLVSFVTVPDIVKKISVDLAIYNLYSRRVEEIPQTRADRYKNAIRQLEGIAKGSISIGEDPAPTGTSASGAEVSVSSEDRIFTRDKMSGY